MRPFKKFKSKYEACLYLLSKNRGNWVSSVKIARFCHSIHHTDLIRVLRKRHGLDISHKLEYKKGETYGFYKLN